MRLCFVCSEYPPGPHGGIGTFVQTLARELVRSGHKVRVVGIYPRNYPAANYEEDRGVRVSRLRESGGPLGWVRGRSLLFRTVSGWARSGKIELVEVPDYQGWAAGWPRLRVPLLARLHGSCSYFRREMGLPANGLMFQLERASLRRADFCLSVSRYTAEQTGDLFKLRSARPVVLYNPVDLPASEPGPQEERCSRRVVFAGTLTPKKGVISLMKAWPIVLQAIPEAKLELYGKDGPWAEGPSMQSYLEGLLPAEARSTARFLGHMSHDDLQRVFRQARVAVFPSYSEAFALSPLEAMASGCPTVYTCRGPGPELIEDGVNGLLVDPDSPVEIAEAIVSVLRDDTLAALLGSNGRQRIEAEFSVVRLIRRNEAFYSQCLREFRRRRLGDVSDRYRRPAGRPV